jgi:hypothetical protein
VDRYTTSYPTVTKAVVDLGRGIMAVDAEWHADLELMLLDNGSLQQDLWGVNLLPYKDPSDFIIYESLINIRPAQRGFGIEIGDPALRAQIKDIVDLLVDYQGEMRVVEEPAAAYAPAPAPERIIPAFGAPTNYPCFKHHKRVTMEKWRSFEPYKRVLMIANEFGRAKALIPGGHATDAMDCYERALEIFHITIEAGRIENISPDIIAGLIRLQERTAGLLVERRLDPDENQSIRDELVRLDPDGYRLFQA